MFDYTLIHHTYHMLFAEITALEDQFANDSSAICLYDLRMIDDGKSNALFHRQKVESEILKMQSFSNIILNSVKSIHVSGSGKESLKFNLDEKWIISHPLDHISSVAIICGIDLFLYL